MVQRMRYLNHAFDYTYRSLGGWSLFATVVVIPIVGFALHWLLAGWGPVSGEVQVWGVYGLAATGLVFVSIFGFNLICAPFRLEREAHNSTKLALQVLQESLPKSTAGRHLTDEQKSILADFLRSAGVRPNTFNVLYTSLSPESADFAADIGDAIKSAGIPCSVHDGVLFESDVRDRGLKLIYGRPSSVLDDFSKRLQVALKELGIFAERRPIDESEIIFFYVARAPEG